MEGRKTEQNTNIYTLNTITEPNTKTMVDRYVFASNFCKDKHVIDCPTGHGYGAVILKALGAKTVFGFDIDKEAIEGNEKRYTDKNIGFGVLDMTSKDMEEFYTVNPDKAKADVVVSIEGFEHVPRECVPQMLKNFKTVCNPDGTIFITTPRRKMPVWDYQGGTHCYEYSINEFVEEIQKVFGNNFELYFAHEFRHQLSPELNTVFSKDIEYADQCAVMVAVIKNK